MNCRDFLIEFEERRGDLTEAALLHVKICTDCRQTSGEQTRVWLMIDNLRQVDAPKNFDFLVKARIAKGAPAQNIQPRFLPALRYVLPIGIVVLLLGFIAFNANYFLGGNSTQQVAAGETQPQIEKTGNNAVSPINSFAGNQVAAVNINNQLTAANSANQNIESNGNFQENQFVAVKFPSKPRTAAVRKNVKDDNDGGSRDSASSSAPITFPIGIKPNQKVETSPDGGSSNAITDKEVLEFIGIKTIRENGNRRVASVAPNTVAERSGVKVGDVIEAINGEKLAAAPLRVKTIEAKTLTISRGTEKTEITLKN